MSSLLENSYFLILLSSH